MIRLGDKLARFMPAPPPERLDAASAVAGRPPDPGGAQGPRSKLTLDHLPRPPQRITTVAHSPLEAALPGRIAKTYVGSTWVAETAYGPRDNHGNIALWSALEADFRHLERMTGDARLAGFDVREALFLDIEATGLEHGAGTLAFLVGIGFFEGDTLHLEQILLRDHDEEPALLALLWERVQRFRYLVSFNGKSFDLSVLQNRMVMHRMCSREESQLKLRPHLDLLHVSRAVYKGLWSDVRLQTLERHVLGFVRHDDMPGSMAAACWFAWLREADPGPLVGIAVHNRHDVLSMVALAGVLAREAEPRPDAGRRSQVALNLAALYVRRKANSEALAVLEDTPPLADYAQREAMLELVVKAARRTGDHRKLVAGLEALLALEPERPQLHKALTRARARLVGAGPRV